MEPVIALLIWIVIVIVIATCVLAVVRALLNLPAFAGMAPYTTVVYALVVLIVVLVIVSQFYGGGAGRWPR